MFYLSPDDYIYLQYQATLTRGFLNVLLVFISRRLYLSRVSDDFNPWFSYCFIYLEYQATLTRGFLNVLFISRRLYLSRVSDDFNP